MLLHAFQHILPTTTTHSRNPSASTTSTSHSDGSSTVEVDSSMQHYDTGYQYPKEKVATECKDAPAYQSVHSKPGAYTQHHGQPGQYSYPAGPYTPTHSIIAAATPSHLTAPTSPASQLRTRTHRPSISQSSHSYSHQHSSLNNSYNSIHLSLQCSADSMDDGADASHASTVSHSQYVTPISTPTNSAQQPRPRTSSAAVPPVSFNHLPALEATRRYIVTGTLHQSLFGVVKLAFDRLQKRQVAIKISRRDLTQYGKSVSGASVLENVRREAAVLRYIQDSAASDNSSNRPAKRCCTPPTSPNHRQRVDSEDSQSSAATRSSSDGRRYICSQSEELEDDLFHYLITEYMAAGDLYSLLSCLPQNRLSEYEARKAFKQIVYALNLLHTRGIAHMDLSLENICLSPNGHCSVIDFGVAAVHPAVVQSQFNPATAHYFQQYQLADSSQFHNITTFKCAARTQGQSKPGKLGYMSPELWSGQEFDCYASDVWASGVILYTMLTGRAPFHKPDGSDAWFDAIHSGRWIQPQFINSPQTGQAAQVYAHLSPTCLSLLDQLLCPAAKRLTVEEVLNHPWLTQNLKQ